MPDKIGIYDVGDHYDPSESENEYDEREKSLLKNIRNRVDKGKRRRGGGDDDEEEVLGFAEDDDEDFEEDEDDDFDEIRKFEHDSDIEDKEDDDDLPDRKAWGSKARSFYGADYVDQDYDSLTAQEEERARLEEIEAKEIQQRLAKELNEADFSLDVFVPEQEAEAEDKKGKKKKEKTEIKLKADLSGLSERQKRELFKKEAPEFDGLVEDFERNLEECHETLEPVLKYLKERNITDHPFLTFLKTRYDLCLSYCNNISFYLLLKSRKIKVKNHPVVKRMVQMKQLLLELEQKYENSIKSQVETLLEHIQAGEELIFDEEQAEPAEEKKRPKKQKKLAMLQGLEDAEQMEDMEMAEDEEEEEQGSDMSGSEDDEEAEPSAKKIRLEESDSEEEQQQDQEEEEEDQEGQLEEAGKRKITYQMAKNKGLTARKKKDQRNTRVKNRRKFQKALVRRKGAIRPVRTETTRYGGEASGIKAYVKRSVKIK